MVWSNRIPLRRLEIHIQYFASTHDPSTQQPHNLMDTYKKISLWCTWTTTPSLSYLHSLSNSNKPNIQANNNNKKTIKRQRNFDRIEIRLNGFRGLFPSKHHYCPYHHQSKLFELPPFSSQGEALLYLKEIDTVDLGLNILVSPVAPARPQRRLQSKEYSRWR